MAYFRGSGGIVKSGALFPLTVLAIAGVANCGGRSSSVESDDGGASASSGDAGATTGGASGVSTGGATTGGVTTGGVSTGGMSIGGSAGDPTDPDVRCRLPVSFGACRTRLGVYWFDAATGLCMPFDFYGCNGNANRFTSAEECYSVCGGRGDQDLAACEVSADCRPKRLAEPCCSLDVQEFVGIHIAEDFTCTEQRICTHCAADCDYSPPDGYIGARCVEGHCIAFDMRTEVPQACMTDANCYPRYGVECCPDCRPEQNPSKLVGLSSLYDLDELVCGEGLSCIDTCDYSGHTARCNEDYLCELVE